MKIEEFSTAKFFLKNRATLVVVTVTLLSCFLYLSLSSLIFAKDEKWKF